MEKPAASKKLKNKILKLLPKVISFQNLPFSPRRDNRPDVNAHRPRPHHNKAFSGPIVSMIPAEARRRPKNFETQEPTSPKVSCTGRVNHKSKISKKKHVSLPKEFQPVSHSQPRESERAGPSGSVKKQKKAGIKKFLRGERKYSDPAGRAEPSGGSAPSLSHMRRFASSRDTFANFDWTTAQIAPEDCSDDEEIRGYSDDDDEGDGGIPFSARIGGGGLDLEPKKEINLWQRRTMAQPRSLQLNMDT